MSAYTNKKGFTVRQIRAILETLPGDSKVILSGDEEGNDFGLVGRIEKDENNNVVMWPMSNTVEVE